MWGESNKGGVIDAHEQRLCHVHTGHFNLKSLNESYDSWGRKIWASYVALTVQCWRREEKTAALLFLLSFKAEDVDREDAVLVEPVHIQSNSQVFFLSFADICLSPNFHTSDGVQEFTKKANIISLQSPKRLLCFPVFWCTCSSS